MYYKLNVGGIDFFYDRFESAMIDEFEFCFSRVKTGSIIEVDESQVDKSRLNMTVPQQYSLILSS